MKNERKKDLKAMDKMAAKSKLTEEDVEELSRKIKQSAAAKFAEALK